jgi:phage shock protein A
MTIQRAQDKIANMQARAGAIDELLASGALTDLNSNSDDIQAQLDKVAATSQVESELVALKTELAAAPAPGGLPVGSSPTLPAAIEREAVSSPSPPAVPTADQPEVTT